MAVWKKIDISFDIPWPIVLNDSISVFKYSSFSRAYHVYKERWQPTVGDDSLYCKEEKDNMYDKYTAAIYYDSFHSNKVVRYVPLYWIELASKIMNFLNNHIRVVVAGKKVTMDIGLGPEIPVDYFFDEDNRVIEWCKKSIEKHDICTDVKVEKMNEITWEICLFTSFLKIMHLFYCFLIYPKIMRPL